MTCNRRTAAKTLIAGVSAVCGLPAIAVGHVTSTGRRETSPDETIKTQVCVIGGGSGGVGAALAAARAGAKVVLLERESVLGGTSTMAWVHTWEPVSGANGIPRDLYMAMKEDPLAVTFPNYDEGAPRRGGHGLPFEPRALDYVARKMLDATGRCRTLLNTTFCRARMENNAVKAVEAWFSGKRLLIEADVFIDCTADGDVCTDAGCEYHIGEDPKSLYNEPTAPEKAEMSLNGLTLCYRITDTGVKQKPYLPEGIKEDSCPLPVHIVKMPNGDLLLNPVGMIGGNAVLCMEYSELMREAHRRVMSHFYQLQNLSPDSRWAGPVKGKGYGTWSISGIAPRIGVRETRRIIGEYVLNENDCRAGVRKQPRRDIIAISDHAVDLHGRKGRLYELPNGPYGTPYGCLLPKGTRNLMIASRAASFSHIAASSCRLNRTMMTLGQAAGAAAAMAVAQHIGPRDVDIAKLQFALRDAGVAISI